MDGWRTNGGRADAVAEFPRRRRAGGSVFWVSPWEGRRGGCRAGGGWPCRPELQAPGCRDDMGMRFSRFLPAAPSGKCFLLSRCFRCFRARLPSPKWSKVHPCVVSWPARGPSWRGAVWGGLFSGFHSSHDSMCLIDIFWDGVPRPVKLANVGSVAAQP